MVRLAAWLFVWLVLATACARSMHVAVRQLFFGRGANVGDLDLEVQVLAG